MEGRAEPPTEPRVDTEIRRPTRTAERSPGMSWSQLNAGATMPQEHATGCNSMQNCPASKTPVGLHLAAQVRHVHSVKKRGPAQQQQLVPPATRHARPAKPATLSPVCKAVGVPCCRPLCISTHQVDSKQDYGPLVPTNLTLKKILHRVAKLILQGAAIRQGRGDGVTVCFALRPRNVQVYLGKGYV